MDANLLDVNRNLERENVGRSGNSTSVTEDIRLASTTSDGSEVNTPSNIEENKAVNESVPAQAIDKTNKPTTEDDTNTKFFAIRITGGQERVVANI
ncbi:MAG: hypothetical protein ACRD4W_12400, partial [Nitrososphaeraceae archaeon]